MKLNNNFIKDQLGFPNHCNDFNFCGSKYPVENDTWDKFVCVGCSITYGYVPDGSNDFTKLLSEHYKNKKIEFINMGRSSFGIKNCFEWFKCYEKFYNNIKYVMIQVPDYIRQPLPELMEDIRIHHCSEYGSIFASKFSDKNKWIVSEEDVISEYEYINKSHEMISKSVEVLFEFCEYLKNKNIIPVVLLYRYIAHVSLDDFSKSHFRIIKKFCKNKNILFLETKDMMELKRGGFTFDVAHLNGDGHKLFFSLIKCFIEKNIFNKDIFNKDKIIFQGTFKNAI